MVAGGQAGDDREIAHALAAIAELETAARRTVEALRTVDARRVVVEEGMGLEAALRCYSGAGGNDVATMLAATERLERLPALRALFRAERLSWAHVRQLTYATRRFRTEQLDALDDWLATHAGHIGRLEVDAQAGVLDDVLRELTPIRTLERRTDRDEVADRLVLQLQLDGSAESYATWSPESAALLAEALHTEADTPHATPCPTPDDPFGDHADRVDRLEATDTAEVAGQPAVPRARQLAAALLRLVTRGRTGADAPTPPTRFSVLVDVDRLTDTTAGSLQVALKGRAPHIVGRTLDRLTCDATIDTVIRHGTNLLAARRYTPDITAATRRAVTARDAGCRWPGCTAPIPWCDLHHVVPRAHTAAIGGNPGGDHHPDNLVLLCRAHHTLVHRRGWHQATQTDGTYALRRRGRTITSIPRNPGLPPPPPPRPRARHTNISPGDPPTPRHHRATTSTPPQPPSDPTIPF